MIEFSLSCDHCGEVHVVGMGLLPGQLRTVARKAHGWGRVRLVGQRSGKLRTYDLCPDCVRKMNEGRAKVDRRAASDLPGQEALT